MLLSYHKRLRMILRSARAERGKQTSYCQLRYDYIGQSYGGWDGVMDREEGVAACREMPEHFLSAR